VRQPSLALPSPAIPDTANPLSPDYDAERTFLTHPGPPDAMFAREPREESWATEREIAVKGIVLQHLREIDHGADLDIECHTAMCLAHLRTTNKALDAWKSRYPLGCLANTYAVMIGDDSAPDFYLMFDPDRRSPAGLSRAIDSCEEHHTEWLSGVKAGRGPWERPSATDPSDPAAGFR
jgi:hypothetical protein